MQRAELSFSVLCNFFVFSQNWVRLCGLEYSRFEFYVSSYKFVAVHLCKRIMRKATLKSYVLACAACRAKAGRFLL